MAQDHFDDPTESLNPPSGPRAIAQRHAAAHAADQRLSQIGPYKILETLGEGGMGIVYLAEQTTPIHRRVALKIIKAGIDTRQVTARFETEREALALMNHPHVAKVFDAGATETGRPYFVMEYVPGIPITDYCDKHRLNTEERLRLFMDVCHAVQHAHQKGIIHRDIKPSNVLVAEVDGKAMAKVIDFGIAKATQQKLSDLTFSTQEGQFIGTPAYMSPEQAGGAPRDLDTRTDVYSLGVLLYELLVGSRPFDDELLRSAMISEVQRIIREVDPPKPSTRLGSLGALSTTIAEHRGTHLRTLARQIRGDLDWIVMKCLEKDRGRRYETVSALGMEIERYLKHEPVLAGPPSAVYRMRKFVRRNRTGVIAASIIGTVLILGIVGTSTGMIWALRERDRAKKAEQLTNESLTETEKARDEAQQVTEFLSDMLASVRPEEQGKDVTVRDVLDEAGKTVGEKLSNQPLVEAQLRHTIATSYFSLGLYSDAERQYLDAATTYRRLLGERDQRTLLCVSNLANAIGSRGGFDSAEALQRSNLEIQRRIKGEADLETLGMSTNLASILLEKGKYAAAENLLSSTLDIQRRVLGEEHVDTLRSMSNLALAYSRQGRYEDSEILFRKAIDIMRRVFGEEHPTTLGSMSNLVASLRGHGKYVDAESLVRRTIDIQRRVQGEHHPATLVSMNNLTLMLRDQGKYEEAENLYRQRIQLMSRVFGEEHPTTLSTVNNLAISLIDQEKCAEAESTFRHILSVQCRVLGDEHPDTLRSKVNVAATLSTQGKYVDAEILYRQALEIMLRTLGDNHPLTLVSMSNLADALSEQGKYAEAEVCARPTLESMRNVLGQENELTLDLMSYLAHSLSGQGRHLEAEMLLLQGYDELQGLRGRSPKRVAEYVKRIVRLYDSWETTEPGKGYAEKAEKWRAKLDELNAETPKSQNAETEEGNEATRQQGNEGDREARKDPNGGLE